MKKRLLLFVAATFLFCLLFYFLKEKKRAAAPQASDVPIAKARLHLNRPVFIPQLQKFSAVSQPEPVTASSEDESEIEISECWKKIGAQTSGENFLARHHDSLNRVIGRWYFSKDSTDRSSNESSLPEKFLLGLSKAGFLIGQEREFEINEDEALSLLKEVSTADPENSAPLLFAANIYQKRGNDKMLKQLLNQIKKTKRFDTYITTITSHMFQEVQSPADLVEAYEAWSTTPIPMYSAATKVLKKNIDLDILVGTQMMRPGLDDSAVLNDVDWLSFEYAFGKMHVEFRDKTKTFPSYDEIIQRKSKGPFNPQKFWMDLEENCDLSVLNPMVEWLRSRPTQKHL